MTRRGITSDKSLHAVWKFLFRGKSDSTAKQTLVPQQQKKIYDLPEFQERILVKF